MDFLFAMLLAFCVSSVCARVLIATRGYHLKYTGDGEHAGPQKTHKGNVPRVGGLGLVIALVAGVVCLSYFKQAAFVGQLAIFLLCLLPAFLAGFWEDLTGTVSPSRRLLATMVGAGLACRLLGISIESVSIPAVDAILQLPFLAELAAVVAIGGAAHAFNIIDGQNGLSSGCTIITLSGIAVVATVTGSINVLSISLILIAANLGFLQHNYPFGHIFLGDGGAYLNGSAIGLLVVQLVSSNAEVSPWFAMAILIYPVWETFYSVIRRRALGLPASQPDARHLHSLFRASDLQKTGWLAFSSAPRLWLLNVVFVGLAILFYKSSVESFLICLLFIATYSFLYYSARKQADSLSATVGAAE